MSGVPSPHSVQDDATVVRDALALVTHDDGGVTCSDPDCYACGPYREAVESAHAALSRLEEQLESAHFTLDRIAASYDPARAEESLRVMYDIARSAAPESRVDGRITKPEWAEKMIERWARADS